MDQFKGSIPSVADDMNGRIVQCSNCQTPFSIPSTIAPPIVKTSLPPRRKFNLRTHFRHYINWCGMRSFVFQVALAAWTGFLAFGYLGLMVSMTTDRSLHRYGTQDVGNSLLMGLCCSIGTWFLVAFPLGIAAIATFQGKGRT